MREDKQRPPITPRHLLFALALVLGFACVITGAVLGTAAGDELSHFGGVALGLTLLAYIFTD